MHFDDNLIPFGSFCYRVVALADHEPSLVMSPRFGLEVREAPFGKRAKRVLCPYWRETDHGTVRCDRLGKEAVLDLDFNKNVRLALAFFGSKQALDSIRSSSYLLPDEVKICGINDPDNADEPEP
jgi:hypothetical protein